MANRVELGIAKLTEVMKKKLAAGEVSQEQIDKLNKSLELDMQEYCMFQEEKSLASMDGRLNLEEAQSVYHYLGECPSTFNAQPFEVKYVLTEVWTSLLKSKAVRA